MLFSVIIVPWRWRRSSRACAILIVILVSVPWRCSAVIPSSSIPDDQYLYRGGYRHADGLKTRHPDRAVCQSGLAANPSWRRSRKRARPATARSLRPRRRWCSACCCSSSPGRGRGGIAAMGLVIFTGLSIGTLSTPFVAGGLSAARNYQAAAPGDRRLVPGAGALTRGAASPHAVSGPGTILPAPAAPCTLFQAVRSRHAPSRNGSELTWMWCLKPQP